MPPSTQRLLDTLDVFLAAAEHDRASWESMAGPSPDVDRLALSIVASDSSIKASMSPYSEARAGCVKLSGFHPMRDRLLENSESRARSSRGAGIYALDESGGNRPSIRRNSPE